MRAAMVESLLVLAAVACLAFLGLVAPLVPAAWWVEAGWICTAVGLLVGAPTGFWYHVKLRAILRQGGRPPPRWWLHPVAHHGRLAPEERPSVMLWFRLGGLGFAVAVLGCALVGGGVLLEGLRAGVF
jgi:hypothetical protein